MDRLIDYICILFSFEWKIQQLLMFIVKYMKKQLRIITLVSFGITFFLFIFIWLTQSNFSFPFFLFTMGFLYFSFALYYINKSIIYLTTVRGFVVSSLYNILMICLIVISTLYFIYNKLQLSTDYESLFIVIPCIICILIWVALSSLANAGTATLVNAIFTGLLGMIQFFVDFRTKFISDSNPSKQLIELSYSSLLLVPFVTLGIATIICAIKQYWVHKYNGDRDINADLILEPAYEEQLCYHFNVIRK